MQNHNDKINKQTQEYFFIKICTSHFIVRVRKGLLKVCVWEGAGDRTETAIFWPHSYGRQCCVFLVLLMLNRRPWGPLCWVMVFFTASYQQLLWPQLNWGPWAPSSWCGFPYHISSITPSDLKLTSLLTELYYSTTPTQSPTRFFGIAYLIVIKRK